MASGVNNLTAVEIRNAVPGKMSDGGGLILLKNEAGGKWIYRYSFTGRRREMRLGAFPEVSLADARKSRNHWRGILQRGTDPISERQRVRQDEAEQLNRDDPTFEEMAITVFDARKASLRGDGTRGRWYSPLKLHVIPKIGHKRMSKVHQRDILAAIKPIWKTKHETAEKALCRTRIIFRQARLMGYDVDPFTVEAARHMLGHHEHHVQAIAATPWKDIPALYALLSENTSAHLSLRWAILTLVRGEGVCGARFDEIDEGVWTVPEARMKGRRGRVSEFRVPLSVPALEILEICESQAWSDFLFPSTRVGGVTGQAQRKILRELNEDGRPHGFRTSFRMWVQDTNLATFDVAETVLGHIVGNKVERSYARSDLLDQHRVVMQKWSDHVTGAKAKVVKLRG